MLRISVQLKRTELCGPEMQVHEGNNTVTVQAGVTQRILLDFLAAYM